MSTELKNIDKSSNEIYTVLPVVAPKIELYNMDCLEYMRTCKDNEFDLAIVDPPYGIGIVKTVNGNYGIRKENKSNINQQTAWDFERPKKEYFNELFRVSKNQIIWGGNYFTPYLPPSMGWVFWDKKNGTSYFSDGELAFTSFERGLRMIREVTVRKDRIHLTQKPKKLYEWLLKNYAEKGDKILDTHLGSGSSAIAAYNYKFDFVGLEIDKEYFDNAVKRFNEYKAQLTLF